MRCSWPQEEGPLATRARTRRGDYFLELAHLLAYGRSHELVGRQGGPEARHPLHALQPSDPAVQARPVLSLAHH